jgi:hypothetical protein
MTTTALTVLGQASATATQLAQQQQLNIIGQQIQKQLATKIAALQQTADPAIAQMQAAQVATLQKQQAAFSSLATSYGQNSGTLVDLQQHLATLQTSASGGDSAGFDAALSAANTDVSNLLVVTAPAPLQSDLVLGLKGNGLAIQSSGAYDLSSPTGQAAAAAAVSAAQTLVGQIAQATTSNQLLASNLSSTRGTQVDTLSSQSQEEQQAAQIATGTQILQLQQQAQNQAHLIELALGNTSALANVIANAINPPQPPSSIFAALGAAAANAAGNAPASAPAILSLFA